MSKPSGLEYLALIILWRAKNEKKKTKQNQEIANKMQREWGKKIWQTACIQLFQYIPITHSPANNNQIRHLLIF